VCGRLGLACVAWWGRCADGVAELRLSQCWSGRGVQTGK